MSDFIELRQIATIVLRRWRLIVLSVVLGSALGFFVSRSIRPVYEATTSVLVGQSIQAVDVSSNDIEVGEYLAVTYAALGRRQPVLAGALDELGLDMSWQQLRRQVQISPVEGTQLLEIAVQSTSPAVARLLADAIARQMILLSPTDAPSQQETESRQFLQGRLESLRLRIGDAQQRIEALEEEMTALQTAAELRAQQSEIDTLEQMITSWESNYAQLLALLDGDDVVNHLSIMEAAEVRPEPIRPRVELNMLLGGMLGLILALGFTLVREYMDDTLRTTEDLEQVLGLTPLGAVGQIAGNGYQEKLISSLGPFAPASEAFNVIRSNIQFVSEGRAPGVILVTSPMLGDGKSLTVANLGLAMARADVKTVVVDADLRRAMQHKIFDVPNESGVAEFLISPEHEPDSYLRDQGNGALWLITSGQPPDNPSELLSSEAMALLLANLVEKFEMVILDGPPVLTAADAAIMSNLVDAVIMVVHSGQTRREEGQRTVSVLRQAGATLLGAVLNRASSSSHTYRYIPYEPPGEEDQDDGTGYRRLRKSYSRVSQLARGVRAVANGHGDVESISDRED